MPAAAAYLYVGCGQTREVSPDAVFYKAESAPLAESLCRLFKREYADDVTFHYAQIESLSNEDQVLLDEALDWLDVYDDPDPGVYDPPPTNDTLARAQYAVRARKWEAILKNRGSRSQEPHGHACAGAARSSTPRRQPRPASIDAVPIGNDSAASSELTPLRRLHQCLVRIDDGVLSLGSELRTLRRADPHGLISTPGRDGAQFAQVKEVQDRIKKWTGPILGAARDAHGACYGIAAYIGAFVDDPVRWETDLREKLRLLRDELAALPHTHGAEADEARIVSLAAGLYAQGTRLEDGLATLEARGTSPRNEDDARTSVGSDNPGTMNARRSQASHLASALRELRLATGELLHRSETVDIYPEPEVKAYYRALRHAESHVNGISSELGYGRENPGHIETEIRESLNRLSQQLEHVASDYNDRPGAYPLPKDITAQAWEALKCLSPLETVLAMTTMKPSDLQMPSEDRRVSGLVLLMLLAQAYYKTLECVVSMASWCSALDLELNHSYLWLTTTLSNLLRNHEDLKDFPVKFEPLFPDLYPSTVRDVDWEDMVAPDAEQFLSTVQRYVHEKGIYEPQAGSTASTFVQLFRPSIDNVIARAVDYNKRMRQYAQKAFGSKPAADSTNAGGVVNANTGAGDDVRSEAARTQVSSQGNVPGTNYDQRPRQIVEMGNPGEPCRVLGVEKRALTDAQRAVISALVKAGAEGMSKDALERVRASARRILKTLATDHDWAKVILLPGQTNGRYRIRT